MKSRSWRSREAHDLEEKNEIQVMGNRKGHDLQGKNEIQIVEKVETA